MGIMLPTMNMGQHTETTGSSCNLHVLHFRRLFSLISESFIYDPLLEMQRQGIRTSVVSLVRMHKVERPFPTDHLIYLPQFPVLDRFMARAFASQYQLSELDSILWPITRRLLRRKIARANPDVILAHFGPDGCFVLPVARELGIPLAVIFYGYDVSRLIQQAGDVWEEKYRVLFEGASLIIGISGYIVDKLNALGAPPAKTLKLPLGTDVERFQYRDPAADYNGGTVKCVHVGRLTAKKAPVVLVRAFARARQLVEEPGRLELTIIGAGELENACRDEIAARGLEDAIHMLGRIPHDEISARLAESHIYTQHCMTGRDGDTEGLGVSFIEASASGLPVVSTRHNGIPEVVLHNRTGLLSEEGDVEGMARNIAALAEDPARWSAFGREGRRHVEQTFALNKTVAQRIAALTELRGNRLAPQGCAPL